MAYCPAKDKPGRAGQRQYIADMDNIRGLTGPELAQAEPLRPQLWLEDRM